MATGRRTDAASISRCGLSLSRRTLVLVIALVWALAVGPQVRAAGDSFVQQDSTPIVSQPGIGGKVLVWVDSGFPLTVLGREGDWLRVWSSQLNVGDDSLWVPAARVGNRPPAGVFDVAYSQEGQTSVGTGFRLEVDGDLDLRVRVRCRIVGTGDDDFVKLTDDVPTALELDGSAASCIVRKLGRSGRIDAVLLTASGRAIAAATTDARRGALRLRTDGPWGSAGGTVLPANFVLMRELPDMGPSFGNPVPPLGNPVPVLGNPVPSLGNPVPPLGNPVPSLGNPVPMMGPVSTFQQPPITPP